MPFLVVAGTTIQVTPTGAAENPAEEIGGTSRAYAGNLRSTIRDEKRVWTFTTKLILQSLLETIRTATRLGAQVTCTGDALSNVSYTCRVKIGAVTQEKVRGGFRCRATLTLTQV